MRRWGSFIGLVLVALSVGVAAATEPLGSEQRISSVGVDGDPTRDVSHAAVAYNSQANEYLVTWSADALATDDEFEVFAQRVTPGGAALGLRVRVSTTGADTDATRDAFASAVAYNSQANEYLVTWYGDGLATDNEFEIFAQRLSATGTELGGDTRVSTTGADTDATRTAESPAVAYNGQANEYLVTWSADGLATDDESEIFAQRLSATGTELGGDTRVSTTGADTDATRDAFGTAATYNGQANEYLVTWEADGLASDDESEIFAQRLSATGTELGGDTRVSTTGADTDATRDAFASAAAYNSQANEYLVTWEADGLATDGETEIFARRHGAGSPPPPPPPTPDTTRPVLTLRALTPQRVVRQGGVQVRAGCNERCRIVVQTRVRIAGRRGTLVLRTQARTTLPGGRVNIRIPLTRTTRRALLAALARGRRVTIVLTVIAADDAANRTRVTRNIRVRR